MRQIADFTLSIVKRIDRETPQGYFAGIDKEAAGVTLASLKVF